MSVVVMEAGGGETSGTQNHPDSGAGEGSVSIAVVLPAAGNGTRMKITQPKQFCLLQGRPVISHTIQAFEKVSSVRQIIVVVSADRRTEMETILTSFDHDTRRVTITCGDATRHRSIALGVDAISKDYQDEVVVVIHDGVRPFVPEEIIMQVARAAKTYGAAGAVRPLVSTVIKPDQDGRLEECLQRSCYRNSEMPQAFQYKVIKEAYEKCSSYDYEHGTECLHLAQKYCGVRAKLIDGPDCLWKITHQRDLLVAEHYLQAEKRDIGDG